MKVLVVAEYYPRAADPVLGIWAHRQTVAARDAGRTMRQVRMMAQTARTELKAELGDTVGEFDFSDLNPRTFVRKHLLDDLDADLTAPTATASPAAAATGLPPNVLKYFTAAAKRSSSVRPTAVICSGHG